MASRRHNRNNLSRADSEFLKYGKDYSRSVGRAYLQELNVGGISVITTLSQRSKRFRDGHFFCDICKYYMVSSDEMEEHRETNAHKRKRKLEEEDAVIDSIQPPTPDHLSALSNYLHDVYERVKADDADIQNRIEVVEGLQRAIEANPTLADVKLQLSGSVVAEFALRDSDTNVRIVAPKDANYLMVFEGIGQVLKSDEGRRYTDVVLNLETRFPYISFRTPTATGIFSLAVIDEGKHHTRIILSAYSKWHTKVRQLGTLLKHCAKQGDVTNVERGGILPMCMPILVIYYCQQQGLLPLLVKSENISEATEEELQNAVEQEHSNLENALRIPRKRLSALLKGYCRCYYKLNDTPLEQLWLDLLRFYSVEFDHERICVSIIEPDQLNKDVKSWPKSKRMAIEEPGMAKRNLCQGASNQQVLDFIKDYIRSTYQHFAIYEVKGGVKRFSFSGGQSMRRHFPIFCRQCHAPGHLAHECTPKELPRCERLYQLSTDDKKLLNSLLKKVKDEIQLTREEQAKRTELFGRVTHLIQSEFAEARPEIFGSTVNGFGSYQSDVDISVVFAGRDTMDQDEMQEVMQDLEQVLKSEAGLRKVHSVLESKVPIVNFLDVKTGIDGDISFYNRLAIRNTKMLHRYSQIDERVRTLGFCLKLLAKECEMADAHQRTLSSYAYILMLIFYLQRCEPPVLPVLQELYDGGEKPQMMVDGCNTWFFNRDNHSLRSKWSGFGKNKQDESELWIGFLDFYSQRFEFHTNVVCIRQIQVVSKLEKLWNSDKLAIEDPFNTGHNLGIALNRESNARILSNLIIARNLFGSPMERASGKSSFEYYFQHKGFQRPKPQPKQ